MTAILLGSLPFPGQSGDQLISKAVSTAIAALFKRTGQLEATVRAEPVAKLLQGSIDGFDFIGKGMLMYNGLRIEAMELYLQAISIDLGAIFKGQVALRQSTQATMRVVLTEEDLTTSFNTPFVVEKLQRLQHQENPLYFKETQMTLNPDKSLRIKTQIRVGDSIESVDVDITARLQVEDRRRIQFVDVQYGGDAAGVELGRALIEHVNTLLDLDKFALDGTQLRVDRIRVNGKQLVFYGAARIDHFPQRRANAAG
ncbi:MAG: DUF2993 domain-containing protein [Leptolyngbyaceae cyanobacterium MO_188.B28]|nr:DUF2993 domain-containing protein [Leptolyngbyaceae cyanobacterium MO_188.B28]